jgi:hypothetical protein
MSAASNYLEAKVLDHTLATTTYTKPTNVYVALFTTSTNLESGVLTNEISTSGTAYARQTATFAAASTSTGSATSSGTITFPTATANWGTVYSLAICDSDVEGSGNILYYGNLDSPKVIETGDTFQIQSGNLTVTLA